MSYEKQTWTNGDIITAEKLNHMEEGITQSNDKRGVYITLTKTLSGNSALTVTGTDADGVEIDETPGMGEEDTYFGPFYDNGHYPLCALAALLKNGNADGNIEMNIPSDNYNGCYTITYIDKSVVGLYPILFNQADIKADSDIYIHLSNPYGDSIQIIRGTDDETGNKVLIAKNLEQGGDSYWGEPQV